MLTIFYDGFCPLCASEMSQLHRLDTQNKLVLENIHDTHFKTRFPNIDPIEADKILHGQLPDGKIIKGLEVTCLAWKLVEKHKWIQILRWPVIRVFADFSYLFFARYRHVISSFLTGKSRCSSCNKGL